VPVWRSMAPVLVLPGERAVGASLPMRGSTEVRRFIIALAAIALIVATIGTTGWRGLAYCLGARVELEIDE
jgi:hypothetical protein